MGQLGGYVLSVLSAAVISGILSSLFREKSPISGIINVVCGLFLTFVMINPLTKLDFASVEDYLNDLTMDGRSVAAMGENMALEAERDIIITGVQAYILDKAISFGAQLTVEVILDHDNMPLSVNLKGKISPYAKVRLTEIIEEDLGIAKEYQIWIG